MRLPVALILAGCAATEPATLVTVRTDAPPGLFDRLVIEVRRAGEDATCTGCRRDVAASELPVTFSILAEGPAPVVRAWLYRDRGKPARTASAIEVYGSFAAAAAAIEVRLRWADVGSVRGSWSEPLDLASVPPLGEPVRGGCTVPVGAGETCVPGGLFWFGDPALDLGGGIDREGNDERLVQLSPYVLDRHEVTLGELRAAGFEPTARCAAFPEGAATGCVPWRRADQYCRAVGKRLPTEAELEYAMGGFASHRFVWGDARPACGDAIYEGCGFDQPQPPGSAPRDRVGELVDLNGNVAEWSADVWNSTREPCFAEPVLHDPLCATATDSTRGRRVVKGAGFTLDPFYLGAAMRAASGETDTSDPGLGFRCAKAGSP